MGILLTLYQMLTFQHNACCVCVCVGGLFEGVYQIHLQIPNVIRGMASNEGGYI